jgi:hypothetical protein
MTQQESDAVINWIDTLPKPIRYFLVFGGCVGGIAMLLVGVVRFITPPEDAGVMYWLSNVGFVLIGPFLVWQAVKLFGRK